MKIHHKVTALMLVLLILLSGLAAYIQQTVLMPRFTELEQHNAQIAMSRVRSSLLRELETMQVQIMDWANWGELYQFVHGTNPEFPSHNITADAMRAFHADALWVVDSGGRVLVSSDQFVPTRLSLDGIISREGSLFKDLVWDRGEETGGSATGLARTPNGFMLLARGPILDGSGRGDAAGIVVMGRLLTAQMLVRIEARAGAKIALLVPSGHDAADRLVETAEVTRVTSTFRDVHGQPALTLRVDVPRDITAYGRHALVVAGLWLIGAASLILTVLLVFLSHWVLTPLTRVTRHAIRIGQDPESSARLNFTSRDEFGQLGSEFDRMTDRFAETRRELVDQSFQAGFAELSKGVLHNLGNALTPLGVRLERLGKLLSEAPAADMRLAVAKLAKEGGAAGSPAHRAELLELLALGTAGMSAIVEEAARDIDVMKRQASLMRASLSEQMRVSSAGPAVLESVRLPELIEQSLEIVPDSNRRRLAVHADESLHRIGAVRVARTVLRMVLQNLIINAADAVRDAGKDKGTFRVAAEIIRESDREQLHLRCEDDGVGIPPDDLQRVFEKGFSTKSRESNHGIGLHWCANAVLSLGGRIWAASEGPGRGASLHVVLPLSVR